MQHVWQKGVLLLAVMALFVPTLTAGAQSAGVGGRVANPDPENPRTQSIFIYKLEHGAVVNDQLLVVNQTDETKTVSLGSVDGVVTNTGDYTCRLPAEPTSGSGGWVTFSKNSVTLPPRGEERVDFRLTVPGQADVGEHNSCLTVQAEGEEGSEASSGVRLRMRQAVRMVVTIPGELHRELSMSEFNAEQRAAGQYYKIGVANKGNVSADVDVRISLTSLFGREVAGISGEYAVIPNENLVKEFTTPFRPLFGGWFEATPSIRYDTRLGVFGTQNNEAEYETITGDSVRIFLWPTLVGWSIIFGAVLSLVLGFWLLVSQLRVQAALRKNARVYVVQEGDTIQGLASSVRVNWRDLAQLNKLRAPYSLTPGQEIQLPARVDSPKKASKKG